MNAARKGHTDIVKFLLEVHADITIINMKGTFDRTLGTPQLVSMSACICHFNFWNGGFGPRVSTAQAMK